MENNVKVTRSKKKFKSARAAWFDIAEDTDFEPKDTIRTEHTSNSWVWLIKNKNNNPTRNTSLKGFKRIKSEERGSVIKWFENKSGDIISIVEGENPREQNIRYTINGKRGEIRGSTSKVERKTDNEIIKIVDIDSKRKKLNPNSEKLTRSSKFKVTETENNFRVRIRDPRDFQKGSFRTLDTGRAGFTKRVIGRLKGERTTTTQAVLFDKGDFGRERARKFAVSLSRNMERIEVQRGAKKARSMRSMVEDREKEVRVREHSRRGRPVVKHKRSKPRRN